MRKTISLIFMGLSMGLFLTAGCINNSSETMVTDTSDSIEVEEHEHDEEHDHSVEIKGSEMKSLTVQEVADLWEIDSELLLSKIIEKFELKENYTVNSVLDGMREEYKFSPAIIKDLAEEIKTGAEN